MKSRPIGDAWTRFWLAPVAPFGLHALRVLAGLLFLSWLLTLAGERHALFGLQGWFDRQAFVEESRLPQPTDLDDERVPTTWSLFFMGGARAEVLDLVYWGAVAVLVLFTCGIATRVTALLTWLIAASFLASPVIRHEADYLMGILAFYLMIGYLLLGQWSRKLSPAQRLLGPLMTSAPFLRDTADEPASHGAGLALRLLQVHFALIVVVSGLHKLQFGSWWAGVALWFPLHPPFDTTPESIKAEAANADAILIGLSVLQYVVLAWQIGFPFFAWRKSCRVVLLGGAALGWLGCIVVTGQPFYGPIFVVMSLSYLTPDEWLWIRDKISLDATRLVGRLPAADPEKKARVGARSSRRDKRPRLSADKRGRLSPRATLNLTSHNRAPSLVE